MLVTVRNVELSGSSYEIGCRLGEITSKVPMLRDFMVANDLRLDDEDFLGASEVFDRWCPGLNEELEGFGDALGVKREQVFYYYMTYLVPRCSSIALLPGKAESGHTLLARNYEFNHETEDFTLFRTCVEGKFAHLGTSVMQFGREEGINDQGLAVSMSSCGFPVGAVGEMRKPVFKGLQFWAVIRALLENCGDVDEALGYLEGMPIAYNLNLMLADRKGQAALYETLDGRVAFRRIDEGSGKDCLFATNHAVLPELQVVEPQAMRHSFVRYEVIRRFMEGNSKVAVGDLKGLLLAMYPQGLCCHYFEEFFGTTKSVVMDANEGTFEICWGGLAENGWEKFCVEEPLKNSLREVRIEMEHADPEIYGFVMP